MNIIIRFLSRSIYYSNRFFEHNWKGNVLLMFKSNLHPFFLIVMKNHSALYKKMAAAFWRRYNNMKNDYQDIRNIQTWTLNCSSFVANWMYYIYVVVVFCFCFLVLAHTYLYCNVHYCFPMHLQNGPRKWFGSMCIFENPILAMM